MSGGINHGLPINCLGITHELWLVSSFFLSTILPYTFSTHLLLVSQVKKSNIGLFLLQKGDIPLPHKLLFIIIGHIFGPFHPYVMCVQIFWNILFLFSHKRKKLLLIFLCVHNILIACLVKLSCFIYGFPFFLAYWPIKVYSF